MHCAAACPQVMPNLPGTSMDGVAKGGYVCHGTPIGTKPDVILMATGTELSLAVDAAKTLEAAGACSSAASPPQPCVLILTPCAGSHYSAVRVPSSPLRRLPAPAPAGALCAGSCSKASERTPRPGRAGKKVRVVSMPCWELLEEQGAAYKASLLGDCKARVSVEAASTQGWHKYLGDNAIAIGWDEFGASAPAPIIYEKFGITTAMVVEAANKSMAM